MSGAGSTVTALTEALGPVSRSCPARLFPLFIGRPVFHLLHPVYLIAEPLHPACRPAHVVRKHGMTLLFIHSRALKAELGMWTAENLTCSERLTLREAFGHDADLDRPLTDALLEGEFGTYVPPSLRLPTRLTSATA